MPQLYLPKAPYEIGDMQPCQAKKHHFPVEDVNWRSLYFDLMIKYDSLQDRYEDLKFRMDGLEK